MPSTEKLSKNRIPKRYKKTTPGLILVALGLIFLLNNYGLTNIDIGKLWPLVLIVPGVMMLIGRDDKK